MQIESVLDATPRGPVGIVLEGGPGIGKTTLLHEALQGADRRSYLTLRANPTEPEARLSFAGLSDLVRGLVGDMLAGLPEPQRHALAAALSLEAPSLTPPDPLALPLAILSILGNLAGRGPLVIAIDDEQWIDPASARVLAFALSRLRDAPLCVLLTRRTESGGALWPELAGCSAFRALDRVTVSPLDLPATEALLNEHLTVTLPKSLVRRVHAASGGNPLYALAIARELKAEHVAERAVPVPATLSEAMDRRLRAVAPAAHESMLAVASMSRPTLALLQAALPDFTIGDLDSAVEADVIELRGERVRFTHPLLASTHYAATPLAERRAMHRGLSEVVADEEERAHHLALGAEGPDGRLASILEEAAGAAALRGAPAAAALLLEDAIRLTPREAADAAQLRRIAAAEQHWAGANADRARALLEAVVPELPAGSARARALDKLSEIRNDDWRVSERLLEQAISEAAAAGDHGLRAQIESHLTGLLSNRAKFTAMLTHAESAVASAERTGDPGALAEALASAAVAQFFNGRPVDQTALARAVQLEDACRCAAYHLPSTARGMILFWGDDHVAARKLLERAAARATDRGEEYERAAIVFHLVVVEWFLGNRGTAEQHLAEVIGMRGQGEVSTDAWTLWAEAKFALDRGDLEPARMRAQEALDVTTRIGDVMIAALPMLLLAEADLWSAQPARAHAQIAPMRESLIADGFGFLGGLTLPLWSVDVEALIATGDVDAAGRVAEDLMRRARAFDNPHALAIAHRGRGLVAAAQGDVPGAIDILAEALAVHTHRPVPPEVARTLIEKGALERRAKRKRAAKQTLEAAVGILEPIGPGLLLDRARDELGRIGLRGPAPSAGLTPAQQRVGELVTAGMSNRQIATSLYMSERTVEAHLTRIYREYGVRSRAQLVKAWPSSG